METLKIGKNRNKKKLRINWKILVKGNKRLLKLNIENWKKL